MLIPSLQQVSRHAYTSLSRRVNANSQRGLHAAMSQHKLIKKGEC